MCSLSASVLLLCLAPDPLILTDFRQTENELTWDYLHSPDWWHRAPGQVQSHTPGSWDWILAAYWGPPRSCAGHPSLMDDCVLHHTLCQALRERGQKNGLICALKRNGPRMCPHFFFNHINSCDLTLSLSHRQWGSKSQCIWSETLCVVQVWLKLVGTISLSTLETYRIRKVCLM